MNAGSTPRHWSPEQALAVYEYLQLLSEQLWHQYRADFIELLGEPAADVLKPDGDAPQQLALFDDLDDGADLPL